MGRRYLYLALAILGWVGISLGQPWCVTFYWSPPESPLADSCTGGNPLPDGTVVEIRWDVDSDGPDFTDPSLPNSFNYTAFGLNGLDQGIGEGYFYLDPYLCTDSLLTPPLIYLRICLNSLRWESSVYNYAEPDTVTPFTWTCISAPCGTVSATPREPIVSEFHLDAVYPNPFNASTTISFALPHDERVQVRVFDITGKLTASLLDAPLPDGVHHVTWNASGVSSGLYFVSVTAGGLQQTQKLVLLK